MKFWQYAMGGFLALLVFGAVTIADSLQFAERNTFSKNPFSLLGTSRASFGGELQFLPSGEMIWLNENSELTVTDTERRLTRGTIALGGTFFPTEQDTEVTNNLWVGNFRIFSGQTTLLVQMGNDNIATILSGGGPIYIFFGNNEAPFVVPAHSQLTFNVMDTLSEDPHIDHYALRKRLKLEPFTTGALVTKLWQVEKALADWREQFGHFAWNLPILWSDQVGPFIAFLEKISPELPEKKVARKRFQEMVAYLLSTKQRVDEHSARERLISFRNDTLSSPEWENVLNTGEQQKKEWTWFELSQKFWLPAVEPDRDERKFSVLWSKNINETEEALRSAILLAHNDRGIRAKEELEKFKELFLKKKFSEEETIVVSQFRREISSLLRAFPLLRSLDNFKFWIQMIHKEREMLLEEEIAFRVISFEIGHEILMFVPEFLQGDTSSPIAQNLNGLWMELDLPVTDNEFSAAERTTIGLIDIVGITGMTLDQVLHARQQDAEQSSLDLRLTELWEKQQEEEVLESGIVNAKNLWEFLAGERITLDLSAFRTTRTETELTTRFANTEKGKRKIEGVFDYHSKNFITLTLGEESIADLPVHRLTYWIKKIGGKFESSSIVIDTEEKGVVQTSPQAVLGRKLTQELLRSLGIEVSRANIEMLDEEYQRCMINKARYTKGLFSAEYDLLSQKFSKISVFSGDSTVSDTGLVDTEKLIEKLDEMLDSIEEKN